MAYNLKYVCVCQKVDASFSFISFDIGKFVAFN